MQTGVNTAGNPYNECMNTNIADRAEKKTACAERETKIKLRWPAFLFVLIFGSGTV